MKKPILLLLLLFSIVTNAQESKLTKQMALDSIQSYYQNFKTGSDMYSDAWELNKPGYEKEFRYVTKNYKVVFDESKFKMVFETYDFPMNKEKSTTTIEFDLKDIDSLDQGPETDIRTELNENDVFVTLSKSINFYASKNKNITVVRYKEGKIKTDLYDRYDIPYVNYYEEKISFSETEIGKYFKFLVDYFKKK
ncbi:MAG: hypothetical protein RLZZ540_3534 [Bacteroidota bacterium]|jgi:hypothetical protein